MYSQLDRPLNTSKDLKKVGIEIQLFKVLSTIHPEYEWLPWKFQQIPILKGFWEDPSNQKKFIEQAAIDLKINEMSDWYNITSTV